MKPNNIIQLISYGVALEIIKISQLLKKKIHFEISSQILRSGTSIGANMEEAIDAQSGKDFIAKLSISSKEARETHYWLRLIKDSNLLDCNTAVIMIERCEEILKIIGSKQKNY